MDAIWTALIIKTARRKRLHPSCSIIAAEEEQKRPPGTSEQPSAFIRRERERGRRRGRGWSNKRWGGRKGKETRREGRDVKEKR